jgi:hypothetical protein
MHIMYTDLHNRMQQNLSNSDDCSPHLHTHLFEVLSSKSTLGVLITLYFIISQLPPHCFREWCTQIYEVQ